MDEFAIGVRNLFQLENSDDVMVVGRVDGKVYSGNGVYITNCGCDDHQIGISMITEIHLREATVEEAENVGVAVRVENGMKLNLRIGSVLHSRGATTKQVQDAYFAAIGDAYVIDKNLEMSDALLQIMTLTDCIEAWRLFSWFHSRREESEEEKQENRKKLNRLAEVVCKKLVNADSIYYVQNTRTGEPHMYSRTVKQEEGYYCSPPEIRIITKAYGDSLKDSFNQKNCELVELVNNEEKTAITNFLGPAFYMNGACGVQLIYDQVGIGAKMLVAPPDFSKLEKKDIPVMNPDLERWLLLMGQLEPSEEEDVKIIYRLYCSFMDREIVKAQLLVPMKTDVVPETDENGKAILKKDTKLMFPMMNGKHDNQAVHMYTDWKRLRMVFGEEWGAMIQPVEGMIERFDCAINMTEHVAAGCYVDKEMFERMKKASENL